MLRKGPKPHPSPTLALPREGTVWRLKKIPSLGRARVGRLSLRNISR